MEQPAVAAREASSTASGLLVSPVTRVAGAIALGAGVEAGRYRPARVAVQQYRGYEEILRGRDLRDSIFMASRCCGYHGGQHAIAAAQALESALGVAPPPLAIAVRNLGLAAETIHAEAAHLVLMVAPDLCQEAVAAAWPDLLRTAQATEAAGAAYHGLGTVGEIMLALNPWTGRWYREALKIARVPFEMFALMQGKYPHPQAVVVGGVGTKVNTTSVHDYLVRLLSLVDPAKQVATMITDLLDFMAAAVPALSEVGSRPPSLVDSGQFDDCRGYDPTGVGLTERGERRWAAPGAVIQGELVTSDLARIAAGFQESAEHTFRAPAGGGLDWDGRYSWSRSVRWEGALVETGPAARLWATALRGRIAPNPLITAEGGAVQMDLPEGALPRLVLEWRPPASWNAIERNRARLHAIVFNALVAANMVLAVLDLQKEGAEATSAGLENRFRNRGERTGSGFAGDGALIHTIELAGQRISRYDVIAPATINLGPGGPAEEAISNTPHLGDTATGIEALIGLRSFDPCGNCASH